MKLPKLYAIADAEALAQRGVALRTFAEALRDAGVRLVQYRDKAGSPQEVLRAAEAISAVFAEADARLVMNDRADLAVLAGWRGVHVGQGDLPVEDARNVLGRSGRCPSEAAKREAGAVDARVWGARKICLVGLSAHTPEQVGEAEASGADYVAVGPVFATSSKKDAEPPVGLEGVRRARALTRKPLVAIGGITRESAPGVIAAGADSVAVIGGLLVEGGRVRKVAEDFLRILG